MDGKKMYWGLSSTASKNTNIPINLSDRDLGTPWSPPGGLAYLDPGLCEAYPHGQLLPHEDVGVVRLAEASLKLVQLTRRESMEIKSYFPALSHITITDILTQVHHNWSMGSYLQVLQDLSRYRNRLLIKM